MADAAVAGGADSIRVGPLAHSERMLKYGTAPAPGERDGRSGHVGRVAVAVSVAIVAGLTA